VVVIIVIVQSFMSSPKVLLHLLELNLMEVQ